jgi:hypothetical protein
MGKKNSESLRKMQQQKRPELRMSWMHLRLQSFRTADVRLCAVPAMARVTCSGDEPTRALLLSTRAEDRRKLEDNIITMVICEFVLVAAVLSTSWIHWLIHS